MKRKKILWITIIVVLFLIGIIVFPILKCRFTSYSFFSMKENNLKKVTYEKDYAPGYVPWNFEGTLIETLTGYENAAGDRIYFDRKWRFSRFEAADLSGDAQTISLTEEELTTAAQELVIEITSEPENIEQLETTLDTEHFCTVWDVEGLGEITTCLHADGSIAYITADYYDTVRVNKEWDRYCYGLDLKGYFSEIEEKYGIVVHLYGDTTYYWVNLNGKNYCCCDVKSDYRDNSGRVHKAKIVYEYPWAYVFDWWLF